MKLKKEFLVHRTGGETLLVPAGNASFSGVVRGNRTFGEILEALKEETDEAGIAAALKEQFEAPEGAVEKDVAAVIAQLREIGALDE